MEVTLWALEKKWINVSSEEFKEFPQEKGESNMSICLCATYW
jgi:hypothetical protein